MPSSPYAGQLPPGPAPDVAAIPDWVKPIDPRFLTLTCAAVPNSQDVAAATKMPFGLVCQPMAETGVELPVVNFGTVGVVRCKDCRTYINPFAAFTNGGSHWRCNICGVVNEVPSAYFSPLDASGRRLDALDRPELSQCSFEVVAPAEYLMRSPMPPTIVFLVDVSQAALQSGMLGVVAGAIKSTLDYLPGGKRTKIGFLTFDQTIHFYSLRPTGGVHMMVLPDLDDPFLPAPNDLLVDLDTCRPQVEQLLDALPTMHARNASPESALGQAMEAALMLMNDVGGKLLTFLALLPSVGPGRLQNRENPHVLGTPKEHALLQSAGDVFSKKAVRASKAQVSIDTFYIAREYMDVATISQVRGGACRAWVV